MKKIVLILIIIPLLAFSLDVEKVVSMYKQMLDEYRSGSYQDPFVEFVHENLLQLQKYRFFRRLLAGGVEKTEFAKTAGDYLFVMYQNWKEESWEKKLANALFLAFLQSEMSGSEPSKSTLKNSPSFNSFFGDYKMYVRSNALNLLRWILAYYTGGTSTPPPVELNLEIKNLGFSYEVDQNVPQDILALLPEDLEEKVKSAIDAVLISKDQSEYRRNVNRSASLLWKEIENRISIIQNNVADLFEKTTPKKVRLLWIRYLLYGFLLIAFRRNYRLILQLILSSEILFVWGSNTVHLNTIENMLFSSVLVFAFIFFNLLLIRKRKYGYTLFTIVFIILLFVPTYISVRELGMDREFESSPYYDQLKSEVFESNDSRVKEILREMSAVSLASKEHTKQLVEHLSLAPEKFLKEGALKEFEPTPNGIFLLINERSQFFSTSNFERRLEIAREMNTSLEDYLSKEKSRYRRYRNALESLEHLVKKISVYTSNRFVEDLEKDLKASLDRYPLITDVTFSFTGEKKNPSLKPYQTISGLKEIFWFFLLFFSALLGGKYVLIPAGATLFAALSTAINWKHLEVFVESGIFPISFETSAAHTFHMEILLIAFSTIILYRNLVKGRVKP
ncbi:MAG: hypothetical protein PWQ80_625 [Thermotoga sp.]|nr:hypothetical protein [Thermotoga sp.]